MPNMKQEVRIFSLIISLISGGFIYYQLLTVGFGFLSFYASFFFIISTPISILLQTRSKIRYIHKRLSGFVMWFISITILFSILFVINKLRNISPVIFSTEFYWEQSVNVEFRKDKTFKALNYNIGGGTLTYGITNCSIH